MNYRISKFSKRLPFLQLSYYNYSTCATYAISGTGGSTIWKYTEVLKKISDIIFPHKILVKSHHSKFLIAKNFSKVYVHITIF